MRFTEDFSWAGFALNNSIKTSKETNYEVIVTPKQKKG